MAKKFDRDFGYLLQIGTKLLRKRENCICKELKIFSGSAIFSSLYSQIIVKLFLVTNSNPGYIPISSFAGKSYTSVALLLYISFFVAIHQLLDTS